jgi:hypothetical protein
MLFNNFDWQKGRVMGENISRYETHQSLRLIPQQVGDTPVNPSQFSDRTLDDSPRARLSQYPTQIFAMYKRINSSCERQ